MFHLLALTAFAIFIPIVIFAQGVINVPLQIQGFAIPAGHIFELVVSFSVITFCYAFVLRSYLKEYKPGKFFIPLVISFILVGVYGLGNGVHFSANSLHHFIITNKISGELAAIAYLYDEKLSHLIWSPALSLMPLSFVMWESITKLQLKEVWQQLYMVVLGGVYGFLISIVFLEAQQGPIIVMLNTAGFGVALFALLTKQVNFKNPGTLFYLVSTVVINLLIIAWRLKFGSFAEPLNVFF